MQRKFVVISLLIHSSLNAVTPAVETIFYCLSQENNHRENNSPQQTTNPLQPVGEIVHQDIESIRQQQENAKALRRLMIMIRHLRQINHPKK